MSAAVLAGAGLFLAAPLLGSSAPSQQILGASVTAEPSPVATDGKTTAPEREGPGTSLGRRRLPDPAGERSSPGVRQAPLPSTLNGYRWPIQNARLTQPFGPATVGSRVVDGKPFHDGLDLATFCGDWIRAAHAGTVLAAGRRFDGYMGWLGDLTAYTARLDAKHLWFTLPNVVVIDDGNGYRSMYAHLRYVAVAAGDVVDAGTYLGTEGRTGNASGCHLHYGLFSPDAATTIGIDPVVSAHMLLPKEELARIDPLLVLPPPESAGIH
ncbi:MAG: M23 family metallopeptidase [Chloroflexota bacterium]